MRLLERVEPVLAKIKVFVFGVGQVDHQNCRTVLDQAHQADRAAGRDIRDKQLLAVDHEFAAAELGSRAQGRQVGAGSRLG
jgi:hypothetical protein